MADTSQIAVLGTGRIDPSQGASSFHRLIASLQAMTVDEMIDFRFRNEVEIRELQEYLEPSRSKLLRHERELLSALKRLVEEYETGASKGSIFDQMREIGEAYSQARSAIALAEGTRS